MLLPPSFIIPLIRKVIGEPRMGCEVGVWNGRTSQSLLKQFTQLHLLMVDRWAVYSSGNCGIISSKAQNSLEVKHAADTALMRTAFAEERRTIITGDSGMVLSFIRDEILDFVFIDADHTREGVLRDMPWIEKVRPSGLVCGHDYGSRRHPGVKLAVDEYVTLGCIDLHVDPSFQVWWFQKKA